VEKNRARDLVEDLMLAANGATASYLAARGFPSFRRALVTPARWARLVALAAKTGERLPPEPSARALAAFLAARRQSAPDRFPALSRVVTKLLGPGEYAAEPTGKPPPGRFGLAVQCYTHSTAPSRRFPDLLSQRLLKAALAGHATPYDDAELAALAQHCATQEANAAKAERQVLKSAAALLLAPRVGERFDAVVTGASKKGTWVRIAEPPVEGRLVSGAEGLDVGDEVDVQLARTDAERGFIDFFRAR
jgi:exoribonuclease-2